MNIRRIIRKLKGVTDIFSAKAKISYSQFGEDLLVDYVMTAIAGKPGFTYLDIGTNDPAAGNNTYLFYQRGQRGVCVEPDPAIWKNIKNKRGRDTVLHAGIGTGTEKKGDLYIFPAGYTGWNTFSKEEAEAKKAESGIGYTVFENIPMLPVNEVIATHFTGSPDFISIDVEGLDMAILQTLDFEKYRPAIICVETAAFSTDHQGAKRRDIMDLVLSKGYTVYADTFINTIFVRQDILKQ